MESERNSSLERMPARDGLEALNALLGTGEALSVDHQRHNDTPPEQGEGTANHPWFSLRDSLQTFLEAMFQIMRRGEATDSNAGDASESEVETEGLIAARPTLQSRRRQLREFIRKFGNYLAYLTLIVMLIMTPIVLYRALSDRKVDEAAYNSAWIMVIGTIIISLRLVYLHLTHWYMPEVQKYVVRIVWMVPLYAVQSYLSLRHHKLRIYIDSFRDFYEAYVIASFVYYLMELLGGQDALTELLRHKNPDLGKHTFPLNLILQPWELGEEFALQCKHGVLQYVVIKCFSTLLTFLCISTKIYGEGEFNWLKAYPYLCFLQNLSVMYALYCLVMLYHAVEAELRSPVNWRPLGKFLCVKGIVFFCWWQGVLIFFLKDHGIIDHLGSWSSNEVAFGLIDYCVVVEMVAFAIAHSFTFTYKEYLPSNVPTQEQNVSVDDESPTRYCPPATLPRPMDFHEALWSSSVPRETIQDIRGIAMPSRILRRSGSSSSTNHQLAGESPVESGAESPTQIEQTAC